MAWVVPVEIAFVLLTAAVIPQTSAWLTTYAGASPLSATLDLIGGSGLVLAGTGLILTGTRTRSGWVAVLAGICWLAADWVGWQGGIVVVRTLATAAAFFFLPLILHLVAVQRRPQARGLMRRLVLPGYVLALLLALAYLLFRDPRTDLYCWSNCADDLLLLRDVPVLGDALRFGVPAFETAVAACIVAVAALTLSRATGASRRLMSPILIPAVFVALGGAAHGIALLIDPHEGPRFPLHVAIYQVRALGVAVLAAGLGWSVIQAWRSRLAVVRLAADLGSTPSSGTVPAIAAEAGDPSLEFLYWLPDQGRYVDASGQFRAAPEEAGRSVLRIMLAGRLIGLALYDPGAVEEGDLDRLLGPAARLALENERLRAELLAKVDETRASRARIVAAGDAARAVAERDLHDGAQQALLAVLYELRAAARTAQEAGEDEAADALRTDIEEAEAVLADLREIAHGIYPAVLADAGLRAALRSLADTADVPVAVREITSERLPLAAERAGYAVVAEAVEVATSIGAQELSVRANRDDDRLVLEIGGLGADVVPAIADRVSAADGAWSMEGGMLRVWIPCA